MEEKINQNIRLVKLSVREAEIMWKMAYKKETVGELAVRKTKIEGQNILKTSSQVYLLNYLKPDPEAPDPPTYPIPKWPIPFGPKHPIDSVVMETSCTSAGCKPITVGDPCSETGCLPSGNTCTAQSCGSGCTGMGCTTTVTGLGDYDFLSSLIIYWSIDRWPILEGIIGIPLLGRFLRYFLLKLIR